MRLQNRAEGCRRPRPHVIRENFEVEDIMDRPPEQRPGGAKLVASGSGVVPLGFDPTAKASLERFKGPLDMGVSGANMRAGATKGRRATKEDAHLLLRLRQLGQTERLQRASDWFWTEFRSKKIKDYEEYRKLYPEGSEADRNLWLIGSYWETAGVLVDHGLLHEDLFFDTFLVKLVWEPLKPIVYGQRRELQEPRLAENFELLYEREQAWQAKHPPKVREPSKTKGYEPLELGGRARSPRPTQRRGR
jgi:hypothetical protein